MTSVIANNNPPSPEEQIKTDLGGLKIDLDYLHSKPQILIDSLYQNTLYAFMQQFTEDFNQLPEAERKSNEMQTLVDDLASKGLITENPDGIGVSPYQSQFANALDGLTMPGERKWISKVLDPAIKAAESTL